MQIRTFHECIIMTRSFIRSYLTKSDRRPKSSLSWAVKNTLLCGAPERDATLKKYLAEDVVNTLNNLEKIYDKLYDDKKNEDLPAHEFYEQLIQAFGRIKACLEEAIHHEKVINGYHNTSGELTAELRNCLNHFNIFWGQTKSAFWGNKDDELDFWEKGGVTDPNSPHFKFERVASKKEMVYKTWDADLERMSKRLKDKVIPIERKPTLFELAPPTYAPPTAPVGAEEGAGTQEPPAKPTRQKVTIEL